MNLTKEEIESMPAGREMDALIAEHVMGAKWYKDSRDNRDCCLFGPSWELGEAWEVCPAPAKYDADEALRHTPPYSRDIAAAWLVLMKMKDERLDYNRNGFLLTEALIEEPLGNWKTVFKCQIGGRDSRAYADTAPLSICRAALSAALLATL